MVAHILVNMIGMNTVNTTKSANHIKAHAIIVPPSGNLFPSSNRTPQHRTNGKHINPNTMPSATDGRKKIMIHKVMIHNNQRGGISTSIPVNCCPLQLDIGSE
eukprot:193754_1